MIVVKIASPRASNVSNVWCVFISTKGSLSSARVMIIVMYVYEICLIFVKIFVNVVNIVNIVMILVNYVNFLIIISTKGSLSSAVVRNWKGKRELALEDCESDNFGQNSEYYFFF